MVTGDGTPDMLERAPLMLMKWRLPEKESHSLKRIITFFIF